MSNPQDVLLELMHQLRHALPMDDLIFVAKLRAAGLLPGNIKAEMKSFITQTDQAGYFLDNMMIPNLSSDTSKLQKLIIIFEGHGSRLTKKVIDDIRNNLTEIKTPTTPENG